MTRWSPEHHEPLTPAEQRARDRKLSPGPYQDAVARMFIGGVQAHTVASFYRIGVTEVAGIVRWVCEANLRRTPESTP